MPKPTFNEWYNLYQHEKKEEFKDLWEQIWNILILIAYPTPTAYDTEFSLNKEDKKSLDKMITDECKKKLQIKHSYWLRKNKKLSECKYEVWLVVDSMTFFIDCVAEEGSCDPNYRGLSEFNPSTLKF